MEPLWTFKLLNAAIPTSLVLGYPTEAIISMFQGDFLYFIPYACVCGLFLSGLIMTQV